MSESEPSSSSGGSHMDDDDDLGEGVEAGDSRPGKILKKRRNKMWMEEYLVKWKGCGDEATWETYDTVHNYPELVEAFENPWMDQAKRELVAREEGSKKRMEGGSGGQGQSQDMTAPPPDSGGSGAAPGCKGLETVGRPEKKMKSAMGPGSGCSSTSSPLSSMTSAEQCLQNPLILANLFKLCTHDLLANCRLVSKTWYRNSLVTWRSTSALIVLHRLRAKDEIYLAKTKDFNTKRFIHSRRTPGEEDKDFDAPSKTSLRTFLTYLGQECRSKPYRQFHLSNWSFPSPPQSSGNSSRDIKSTQGQQDRFWELVGCHVTFLRLSNCSFEDASAFRNIIFQTCPKLQTLIIHNCNSLDPLDQSEKLTWSQYQAPAYGEQKNLKSLSVSRDQYQELPISYVELLSHFPALTTLNLTYKTLLEYNNHDADTKDLILWINGVKVVGQHAKNKFTLAKLNLSPGFEVGYSTNPETFRELCVLFQEMNLCVELLEVKFHSDTDDVVEVLKDVLTLSGETIRKMRALKDGRAGASRYRPRRRTTPPSKEFPCNFPFGVELVNLEELTLSADFCRDMEFMKLTPNLGKLRIVKNDREVGHQGAILDKMVLNSSEAFMGGVKLLKLKELWMGYRLHDVEETRRFCGWMPNLEVATMFLDDEQFGVICENWSNLKHLHVLGSRLGDKGITGMGFYGDGLAVRPNITLLKQLTCFQFGVMTSTLSDSSIYNGFLKLSNLEVLEIASYKSTIGDEAITAIHERVPNCQIICTPEMYWLGGHMPQLRSRNIKCPYFP